MSGYDEDEQRRGRRRRQVSADESALWQAFTRSFAPLNRHARREQAAKAGKPADSVISLSPPLVEPDSMTFAELLDAVDETGKLPAKPAPAVAALKPQLPQPKPKPETREGFDHKTAKKLARGQLEIEARLDLHGHRQTEAHIALKSFLLSAQARGLRYVKVITGKGGAAVLDERPFDLYGNEERGILRRMVPQWLADPEFRDLVVRWSSAGRAHGGDGALYIHIRQKRRS